MDPPGQPADKSRGQREAFALRGRKSDRTERGVSLVERAVGQYRASTMRLWAWGQSDPGRKRERNEDSYLVDPETGVMAVADGMGGHQGGATASRMAVEYLGRELAEVRGNFDAALLEQIQGEMHVRTTEEMPVVSDLAEASTPPSGSKPVIAAPVRGNDPTLPPGAV